EKRVITFECGGLDDTRFAKTSERTLIRAVADALVVHELLAEVIEKLLVFGHAFGAASISDRCRDVRAEPDLCRCVAVKFPLEVVRPVPRRYQYCEFGELRAESAVVLVVQTHLQDGNHVVGHT